MKRDEVLRLGTESHYEDAAYYDHVYRQRRKDVRFYVAMAEKYGGPVLELGVGTGRIAAEIALRGIAVVGIDSMEPMLARARSRMAKLPKDARGNVELVRGDFLRLDLHRRFPLVTAPFNAFMHLYDREEVERALRTVRTHLRPSGRFVFDVLLPDPKALGRDPDRVYRCRPTTHPVDRRRYDYLENYQYDAVRQVQIINTAFQDPKNKKDVFTRPLAHRQFFPAELEALLHYNGLDIEHRWGDFERGPISGDSESQVIVARRARKR